MKFKCRYSGLELEVSYFPNRSKGKEIIQSHPIFQLPLRELFKFKAESVSPEFGEANSYLLTLALLKQSELVDFETSAIVSEKTYSIVTQNLPLLFDAIHRVVSIASNPAKFFPTFRISKQTRDLTNLRNWITVWNEEYVSFLRAEKKQKEISKLERKSAALERLIKTPRIKAEKYSETLASWAAIAGSFPPALSEFWKQIIVSCHKQEDILSLEKSDIRELLEHCQENIEIGTIQSHHLFSILEEALETNQTFFEIISDGDGDTTLSSRNAEDATIKILVANAPIKEPKRSDYATEFAFMRARMNWNLAQKTNGKGN